MYGAKVWLGMVCGALLIAAASSRPAAAIEWNLEGSSGRVNQLTFDAVGSATDDIKVRGYYLNNSSTSDGDYGRFRTGQVQNWDGGVGIWAGDDSGSPQHSIDNDGKDNFLLVEFDDPSYKLTAFQIGWSYTDADVEVWIGGADLGPDLSLERYDTARCGGNCDYNDLEELGFTKISVYYDVVVGAWVPVNTDVTGRYVIFSGKYDSSERYDNDFFKLSGIRGQEEVEVPEPGSMLILSSALAVLGAGALRRRWRRSDGERASR